MVNPLSARPTLSAVAAGALLLAAAAAGAAPAAASGIPARTSASHRSPIQHVVVLYLENHSFDNVLGYWCDQTRRCVGMPPSVDLADGPVIRPGVTPDTVPNISHTVAAQRKAINGGRMNGWDKVPGCGATNGYACVSGYEPSAVPNLTTLARRYAVSDETFSMADSPSWGGHLYAVMPTLDHFTGDNPVAAPGVKAGSGWGCDSNKITPWINPSTGVKQMEPSCIPDPALSLPNGGAFEPSDVPYAPTILDEFQSAGVSWKIYGSHYGQKGYIWATCPSLAECLDSSQHTHEVASSSFTTAALSGNLPDFSLVVPGGATAPDSQHNLTSMTRGDNWIGQVANAVQTGPEWRSTVLFITYDDCGCFYDQVSPGRNPDGTQQGPRVPLVIISPWVKPGYTDSTPTTFAGILAYTEHLFGLPPLGANDANAYDFSDAFNFSHASMTPARMVVRPLPASARHLPALDPNDPT